MKRGAVKPEKFEHAGEWIRWRRESTRYSLRDFADLFQKSHTWLQRIENNEIKATRELIEAVAGITDGDVSEGLRLLLPVYADLPTVAHLDIDSVRNSPDDPELIRAMAERVAAYTGRLLQPAPGTAARQLSEAPPDETAAESERRMTEEAKRRKMGRQRG